MGVPESPELVEEKLSCLWNCASGGNTTDDDKRSMGRGGCSCKLCYLITASHGGRCLHLLRHNALLLLGGIVSTCGGHRLLLQLLRFGLITQILVCGGRSCGDRRGGDIRATPQFRTRGHRRLIGPITPYICVIYNKQASKQTEGTCIRTHTCTIRGLRMGASIHCSRSSTGVL